MSQSPNRATRIPSFLELSRQGERRGGREGEGGAAAAVATFFGTTSDTGHLTVGVSLRQIAGDMTQFSRIYNTVNVASNQGRSVPEGEEGPAAAEGKDGKYKSDCSGTTPVFGIKFTMISKCPRAFSPHLDGARPGIRLDGGGGDEEDGDGGRHGEGPAHRHSAHRAMDGYRH